MELGIIIQARMGSSRLPGKVLKRIGNKTLLEHIIFRLSKLKNVTRIVIATSNLDKDDIIENFCIKHNVNYFRGSESNVLERYYFCAKRYGFEHIIRLTGDNPFTDIIELDNLIYLHIKNKADYSRSFSTLPKGVGAEIFAFEALEKSYIKSSKPNHFEHVNEYIEENENEFKISELNVSKGKNRPDITLTIDTEEDYKKACFIMENSSKDYITTEEAIALCLRYA